MTFPFSIDTQIPAANNDPADDQPLMKDNFANIAGFLNVNHIPAGTNDGGRGAGFHKLITYYKKNPGDFVPVAAPPDPTLLSFTAQSNNAIFSGVVSGPAITVQQPFYWSANAVYSASPIKAFGLLQLNNAPAAPGFLTILNGFNINSLQTPSGGNAGRTFTLNLFNPNVVQGNNVAVFFMPQNTTSPNVQITVTSWSFTNPVLTFTLSSQVTAAFNMSVMILQV